MTKRYFWQYCFLIFSCLMCSAQCFRHSNYWGSSLSPSSLQKSIGHGCFSCVAFSLKWHHVLLCAYCVFFGIWHVQFLWPKWWHWLSVRNVSCKSSMLNWHHVLWCAQRVLLRKGWLYARGSTSPGMGVPMRWVDLFVPFLLRRLCVGKKVAFIIGWKSPLR